MVAVFFWRWWMVSRAKAKAQAAENGTGTRYFLTLYPIRSTQTTTTTTSLLADEAPPLVLGIA